MWITDTSTFLVHHLVANIWTTEHQSQAKMTFTLFITVGKLHAGRHHLLNKISGQWAVPLAFLISSKICSLASEATWDDEGNLRQWWFMQRFGARSVFVWAKWLQGMKWGRVMKEMRWWIYCPGHLPASQVADFSRAGWCQRLVYRLTCNNILCVVWATWWANQTAWPNIPFSEWMEGEERKEWWTMG